MCDETSHREWYLGVLTEGQRCSYITNHRPTHNNIDRSLQKQQNTYPRTQTIRNLNRQCARRLQKICSRFPEKYWLDVDNAARWPSEFQEEIANAGWLGIMMPSEYGGSELGLAEATVMMQTIAESGGGYTASSSVHMNIFGLAPVVKYGNEEQKERFLKPLIAGKERACFAVTEPNTGLDTLKLQSLATKRGDHYILKEARSGPPRRRWRRRFSSWSEPRR